MITIKLVDARRGLNLKCRELFGNERIAEAIYRYLCEGIEECDNAEPERKKGKWKEVYSESDGANSWIEFGCPHCGMAFGIESGQYGWHYTDPIPWKACPMCGGLADMRGEEE